ncbi:MAG: hypoxanthine phosphoribosyltransferase [Lentisphaerae bacterium]|nr:hypoxanthine phosphoribosyltransferase [Lentisphaerota bacterium]
MNIKEFVGRRQIAEKIAVLGRELTEYYRGKPLTVIVLMNGGAFFGSDLAREIDLPLWFDSMRASSYIHDCRCDEVKVTATLKLPVNGRDVLLVDDVFDSGETVKKCQSLLKQAGANSVKAAVLVNKQVPGRACQPDWSCFDAPDLYLVGFGLDSEEFYRNVPCIGVIE